MVTLINEKFRLSYWPAKTDVLPQVFQADVDEDDGRILVGPITGCRRIDKEVFLRQLLELNLDAADGVAGFIARNGVLVPAGESFLPVAEEVGLPEALASSRACPAPSVPKDGWRSLPLAEVVLYLRLLRDMVRVLDYEARYVRAEPEPRWVWESTWRAKPRVIQEKAEFLRRYLNAGIGGFRLQLNLGRAPAVEPFYLYPVLCLQIANHMAEGRWYKVCEECGGLFVEQKGSGAKHPWRGRAKYCTRQCAVTASGRSDFKKRSDVVPRHIRLGWKTPAHLRAQTREYFETHPEEERLYLEMRRRAKARQARREEQPKE
jgi:hypothetical protein